MLSFINTLGQGGTGLVVRDHTGRLVCAQARWHEFSGLARMMEATAIKDDVVLASDMGWRKIWVESDAFEVVNLWKSQEFAKSGYIQASSQD